jgi:DNA segregation ATPase FtsK/SpoIIIE-like protein
MEEMGLVGPADGSRSREVLVPKDGDGDATPDEDGE